MSIWGCTLWNIYMIKFPKQIAAYSLVYGDKSFFATSTISSTATISRSSLCPTKMKFLIATVPCNNKNISSLFLTKLMSFGNTAMIFENAYSWVSLFVFLRRVHKRSRTCYRIVESTTLITLCSTVGLIFSFEESREDNESETEPNYK